MACAVFLLILSQAVVLLADDTGDVSRISVQQAKELLGRPDTMVVDVRTYRNWWRSSKKIPTAVREDPAKVYQWIEKYLKNQTLILYCS
jgi:rhodanese-related sulfurtransferase